MDKSREFTDVARTASAVPLAETIETIPYTPRYDLAGNELPHPAPQTPTRPQVPPKPQVKASPPQPASAWSPSATPGSMLAPPTTHTVKEFPPAQKLAQGTIASGSFSDQQASSLRIKNIVSISGVALVLMLVFGGIVSHQNSTQQSSVSVTMPISSAAVNASTARPEPDACYRLSLPKNVKGPRIS